MSDAFQNPSEAAIRDLLGRIRTIAVVGLSPKPARPSYVVASAMQRFGYRIIPVRPAVEEVLRERAYADLLQLAEPVELVDVFRAPEHVPELVEQCIEIGASALWLQDGVIHQEAAQRARAAGLTVVMDRCLYRDYERLNVAAAREAAALRSPT